MAKTAFILSDESVNSYGFRVRTSGIALERFKANPVMLFNHDTNKHIGKWDEVKVKGGQLLATPDIDEEDTTGKEVSRKVEKGYLKAASIGFRILKMEKGEDGVPVASEIELMEASIVSLPANGNALRILDKDGKQLSHEQVTTLLSAVNTTPKPNQSDMKLSEENLKKLGLSADATEEEINAAIEKQLGEKKVDPKGEPSEEVKQLSADVKKLRQERNQEIVSLAVQQGKILASQAKTYESRLDSNFEETKKELDELPARKKLGAEVSVPKDDKGNELSFDELRKNDYARLMEIKKNDPELYQELLSKSKHYKHLG